MSALEYVYIVCFVFGLAYAIFSTVLGGDHGAHAGGFDASHDVSGHIDTGEGPDSGTIHFSPLSPVVIAMFITAFGAAGMICIKAFHIQPLFSLPVAVLSGLVTAALTFYIFVTLFQKTQGSSEAHISSMIGEQAEVITPIPATGIGEIAYVCKGSRYTAPARSLNNVEIGRNAVVVVDKIVGNTFFVKL